MAKDLGDTLRDGFGQVVKEVAQGMGDGKSKSKSSGGGLSGMKGVAAGAGLASLAPLAVKAAGPVKRMMAGKAAGQGTKSAKDAISDAGSKAGEKAGEGVGGKLKESVDEKVEEAGGLGGLAKDAVGSALPFGGGGGGGGGGSVPGVGKNRRMPVQQAVDVAVPLETAYNQWTQFEDWSDFMFRVNTVSQDDDCTVTMTVKQWNVTRQFTAEIETQRPDERIKWKVNQGVTHTGVVTFHELAENLTRIEINIDVDPSGIIEKAGRGMRHVKRTVRSELHRFKAFIEMQETETGAWRGVIEEGEVVEEHPEDYDEGREYSDIEDAVSDEDEDQDQDSSDEETTDDASQDEDEEEDDDEGRDEEEQERPARRRGTASQRSGSRSRGSGSGRSRSRSNGSSQSNGSSRSKPSRPRKPASRR
jgi:uncharacterized membrane protein